MSAPPATIPLPAWHPATLLATWFGIGWLPRMPGTWGSAAALPFAWALDFWLGSVGLAAAAAVLFAAGWWAADRYARALERDDPGAVVVDEVVAQWLVALPVAHEPWLLVVAFFVFRVLDIGKPWPARWADRRLHGGLGIMLDDVLAAIYGVPAMWLLAYWWGGGF